MTVIRIVKNKDNPYVIINRNSMQDETISWKARGLLAYLLSLPDDWIINRLDLIKRSILDGRDSLDSGLKELMKAGYLRRYSYRQEGKFASVEYCVYEQPLRENIAVLEDVLPETDFPESVKLEPVNPSLLNNNINNNNINNISRIEDDAEVCDDDQNLKEKKKGIVYPAKFEEFWSHCIKKVDKQAAYKQYKIYIKNVDHKTLVEGMIKYKKKCIEENTEDRFILSPCRWLERGKWMDESKNEIPTQNQSTDKVIEESLQKVNPDLLEFSKILISNMEIATFNSWFLELRLKIKDQMAYLITSSPTKKNNIELYHFENVKLAMNKAYPNYKFEGICIERE